jgi:multiple sugar transport system ATP-binding protein
MTMASRIVVMKDGYIQQVGAPKDIYDYPDNVFVGGFIGTPPMNFIEGKINEDGVFTSEGIQVQASKRHIKLLKEKNYLDKEIILGIRPEDLYDDEKSKVLYKDSIVKFTVDVAELLGSETSVFAKVGNNDVTAMIDARADIQIGDHLHLALNMEKAHFFDPETKLRIKK